MTEDVLNTAETASNAVEAAPALQQALVQTATDPQKAEQATRLQDLVAIGESTVYLMGLSFIIGSLFTILILLVFDFMRRNAKK